MPGSLQIDGLTVRSVPTSEVFCDTGNGHGSTDTTVRRFTNATTTGTAITRASTAANGDTFTINEDGVYAMSYTDRVTASSGRHGFSVNASGTTAINSLAAGTERLMEQQTITTAGGVSVTVRLSSGDVIRPHTDGFGNESTGAEVQFRITQVSRL